MSEAQLEALRKLHSPGRYPRNTFWRKLRFAASYTPIPRDDIDFCREDSQLYPCKTLRATFPDEFPEEPNEPTHYFF